MMTKNNNPTKRRKFNVLYFGPRGLQGGIGGSARLVNMLGVLARLKANTYLISYLPESRFKVIKKQINSSLDTTTICVPASSAKIFKAIALLQIFIQGLRQARKSAIIFSHSPSIVYGLPALILARIFGRPLLIDLTDSKDNNTPGFIYKGVLRNANIVFAVSRYLTESARAAGCRNVIHAPGFISAETFRHNPSERKRIRKELNIAGDEVVIGYSGAFSPDEGLSYLVKAFERLTGHHRNIRLVLLGGRNVTGSDDIPQLINKLGIKERVIVIPPQPYEMVPAYLSTFDIACSPKVDRELNRAADPIRVYEYMSVGLPVVASRVGETANAIEDGSDGFLVKPEDENDLARVLDYVIQNLGSLQPLREKAREKVINNYTQEVIMKKLQTQLKKLTTIEI
ncbi:glycosyltransferase [Chloroflexota bacterium]